MGYDMDDTCMIFVDDSNVWIEAQKFAASGKGRLPKLKDTDQDPRYRVNIGQLIKTISRRRQVLGAFLYGSRPPPNDAVWDSYKRFHFEVKIYDRANNGKEKQVDNSMATDISRMATELRVGAGYDVKVKQKLDNMTFIIISGDRDMLPPVRCALESNIRVEVWAWEPSISREHKQLNGGSLRVHYLENIADQIFFTNTRSTRKGRKIDIGKAVVLCELIDEDKNMDALQAVVSDRLLEKCPVMFYITRSQSGAELFVEFPNLKSLENVIRIVRELFKGTWTVESWPEYASRLNKKDPATLEVGDMYQPLREDDGKNSSPVTTKEKAKPAEPQAKPWGGWNLPKPGAGQGRDENEDTGAFDDVDADEDDGWQTAKSRNNPKADHRRGMRQAQRCPNGLHCKKAANCDHYHIEEEKNLFRDFPNQNFAKWKSAKCNRDYCRRGRRCPYAHSEADAWCLKCFKWGHYTDGCQFGTW